LEHKTKSFFKELLYRLQTDDISAWSAKLAFFLLLSIFPFIIFTMEIFSHITLDTTDSINMLTQSFPPEILSVINYIIADISSINRSASIISIAIIATLWASSKGIMAIIGGLNMAYREKETRSYIYLRFLSLVYTIAFAVIIIITLAFIVFGKRILDFMFFHIPFLAQWTYTIDSIRFITSIVLSFLFFILLYNASPNKRIMIKDVMPGAIFSTISWHLLSFLFSLYVNNAGSFSYMYGSLTGIIILLLWLYFSSTIIIIGGELNAIISLVKDTSYKQ